MHLLSQTVFYFIDTVLREYKCRGRPNFFSHEALVVGLPWFKAVKCLLLPRPFKMSCIHGINCRSEYAFLFDSR